MFGASKFAIDPCRKHPGFNDIGTIIGVGSSLIGGSMQSDAASNAAATTGASADRATQLQREMWQQQLADQKPWQQAGTNALAQMQGGMKNFTGDQGYSFRLKESMKGLEQGAAARGGLLSGNMLRGAQEYGQGLASQEYNNAYSRLAQMAEFGRDANSAMGAAGQNHANNLGYIGMQQGMNAGNAGLMAGQARASSMQGIGNALGGVDWGNMNFGGGNQNYKSNMGGVNTSLQGFYQPAF